MENEKITLSLPCISNDLLIPVKTIFVVLNAEKDLNDDSVRQKYLRIIKSYEVNYSSFTQYELKNYQKDAVYYYPVIRQIKRIVQLALSD